MQAREAAYRILTDIENGAYANIILDGFLRKHELSPADRALTTEIVYGAVKYQLKLDYLIKQLVKKAGQLETGPRLLLRLSFYQLLFLDRIPSSAVTNESVKLAKKFFHSGIAALVNGVLRNYLRDPRKVAWPDPVQNPAGYLEAEYSHPRWMIERWLVRYGFADTEKLCRFNNEPAPLWIRTNMLRCTPLELMERLAREGCVVRQNSKAAEGLLLLKAPAVYKLPSFQEGLFTVQDESSMLVAHALNPLPGDTVLDVCAAPGGKTTHLAELMKNQGAITACDIHEHRLRLIEENADRLGIKIIQTVLQDAVKLGESAGGKQYKLILVDAPCSGLGVLRRRADARWHKSRDDIKNLARLQQEIVESALQLLASGGRLVYSTCTLEPEENQDVITATLARHPELRLIPDLPGAEGGMRQFLPFRDHQEGFFIAGLKKA